MKPKEQIIVTISKAKFDKLSKAKQRMVVAQDVIDRIELGQISASTGKFCQINTLEKERKMSIKTFFESPDSHCEACAKGGLFISFIGIVNTFTIDELSKSRCGWNSGLLIGHQMSSNEMEVLSKIFEPKQLAMIETAFEGVSFSHNSSVLSRPHNSSELNKCIDYKNKKCRRLSSNEEVLIAIMKNIIKNNGTFKP